MRETTDPVFEFCKVSVEYFQSWLICVCPFNMLMESKYLQSLLLLPEWSLLCYVTYVMLCHVSLQFGTLQMLSIKTIVLPQADGSCRTKHLEGTRLRKSVLCYTQDQVKSGHLLLEHLIKSLMQLLLLFFILVHAHVSSLAGSLSYQRQIRALLLLLFTWLDEILFSVYMTSHESSPEIIYREYP